MLRVLPRFPMAPLVGTKFAELLELHDGQGLRREEQRCVCVCVCSGLSLSCVYGILRKMQPSEARTTC